MPTKYSNTFIMAVQDSSVSAVTDPKHGQTIFDWNMSFSMSVDSSFVDAEVEQLVFCEIFVPEKCTDRFFQNSVDENIYRNGK